MMDLPPESGVIYLDNASFTGRWAPVDALPPGPPPRKSRRELRAERAVLKARRKARKGSHRR